MRAIPAEVIHLLTHARGVWSPDLIEIVLLDGTTVRYCTGGVPIKWVDVQWQASDALLKIGSIRTSRGLQTDQLTIDVLAGTDHLLYGIPWLQALANGALDEARITVKRLFARAPGETFVGEMIRFAGAVGDVECSLVSGTIPVLSDLQLLDTNVPRSCYQAGCRWSLYGPGCAVSRIAHQIDTTVTSSASTQARLLVNDGGLADGWLSGGKIRVTSGPNAGATRTVKSHTTGIVELSYPLPNAVAAGDAISMWPGCDHTWETCKTKFNNGGRFSGMPFIPSAESIT